MHNNKFILTLIVFLVLSACRKDELPVNPPDKGSVITSSVSMSSNYKYQIYFDLSSHSNKGQHPKTDWDLGISTASGSNDIILNTSKMMFVAPISGLTFDQIQDTLGFASIKKTDEPRGLSTDLACFGHQLFIVDKGMNEIGQHLGFFKLEILAQTQSTVTLKCANLNGTSEETKTISKNSNYNYVFINWENSINEVMIEPAKNEWDLIFTQYTHLFHEPEFTPYLVTGCLLNSTATFAIEVSNKSFESIDLSYAESQFYDYKRDAIGYDWKEFNGTVYTVNSEKVFIIKDQEGFYYKLRFIDYYDELGIKGAPQFEHQRL